MPSAAAGRDILAAGRAGTRPVRWLRLDAARCPDAWRRYFGIEFDADYHAIARRRLANDPVPCEEDF
jgi:hypothetical protein